MQPENIKLTSSAVAKSLDEKEDELEIYGFQPPSGFGLPTCCCEFTIIPHSGCRYVDPGNFVTFESYPTYVDRIRSELILGIRVFNFILENIPVQYWGKLFDQMNNGSK